MIRSTSHHSQCITGQKYMQKRSICDENDVNLNFTFTWKETPKLQSSRFTSPRSMLQKPYVFHTTLQFCHVFYTYFLLSPFSLILECCTKYMQHLQRYTICFVYYNVVRNAFRICNIVYFQCILCNVLS